MDSELIRNKYKNSEVLSTQVHCKCNKSSFTRQLVMQQSLATTNGLCILLLEQNTTGSKEAGQTLQPLRNTPLIALFAKYNTLGVPLTTKSKVLPEATSAIL